MTRAASVRRALGTVVLGTAAALGTAGIAAAQALPSPALLVLNKGDATLSIIDPSSGKTVGQAATGEGPHEVVVSQDGRTAFVSNYGGAPASTSLSRIDLASRKEQRVDVSPLMRPHGLWVSGGSVYFTAETNRAVGRYDPAAGKVDWIMGTGQASTHMVMANADGTKLYTANIGSDSLSILERSANSPLAWTVTTVPVGQGPEGFDISPDGRELWAAQSRDGAISIVDLAEKKVTATFDIGTKRSNRLKFTPDGRHVLVSDLDAGELVVVDVAARKVQTRVPLGPQPEGILVVPDGSRAYVAVSGDAHLAVVDLKTFEVVGKVATGAGPDGMAWIP
jgi:YVTN family beta-propeller protein